MMISAPRRVSSMERSDSARDPTFRLDSEKHGMQAIALTAAVASDPSMCLPAAGTTSEAPTVVSRGDDQQRPQASSSAAPDENGEASTSSSDGSDGVRASTVSQSVLSRFHVGQRQPA